MKLTDYRADNRPGLIDDILETPDILERFDPAAAAAMAQQAKPFDTLLLTGEGSSRIFPARQAMARARIRGDFSLAVAGATEAVFMDLTRAAVLAATNSGRTAEVIRLGQFLREGKHPGFFGLTSASDSLLAALTARTHVLGCGKEKAVAATKSVAEQALFVGTLTALRRGFAPPDGKSMAVAFRKVFDTPVEKEMVHAFSEAETVYFAGREDGTAEELSLKCNEILRKPSRFLEGTFLLHGVEEVMKKGDLLVIVDPFPGTEKQIGRILGERTGIRIAVIGSGDSPFPGFRHPDTGEANPFLQLAAGWVLLSLAGILSGIDIDNPVRARKVGNEYNPDNAEEGIRVLP
jgi:glucosamine--fructose-6-phosphate aminotransferase (isomerizing)